MLCWRFYHTQHIFNICCDRGQTCCVTGLTYTTYFQTYVVLAVLPYTTHFQTYVVLEVKCVVLEVFNTFSRYVVCRLLIDHRIKPCEQYPFILTRFVGRMSIWGGGGGGSPSRPRDYSTTLWWWSGFWNRKYEFP